jgi:hypothetical protein
MLRKGQFEGGIEAGLSAAEQFYSVTATVLGAQLALASC